MARYYFHIREGSLIIPDNEGMELPDTQDAWLEARESAEDVARSAIRSGFSAVPCAIEIADHSGMILGAVTVPARRIA